MSYQINPPYWSNNPPDGQGVRLSWTWPPSDFIGAADPLLAILYIQRSTSTDPTINTHWPLSPNFIDDVGSQFEPTPETGWETIKTINVPPQFMTNTAPTDASNLAQWLLSRTYIDPIPAPTVSTYYRIVGFAQVDVGPDRFFEWDWAPTFIIPSAPGEAVFLNTYVGSGSSAVQAVTTDSSGNIYVAGYFNGTITLGSDTFTALGITDTFLMKLPSSGGAPVLVKRFGKAGAFQVPTSIKVDSLGNIYIGGNFRGTANFGGSDINPIGFQQTAFVAKFTSAGVNSWAVAYGGTDSGAVNDMVVGSDNKPVTVGLFQNAGSSRMSAFKKFNSNDGSEAWSHTPNDAHPLFPGNNFGQGVAIDSSDSVYFSGFTSSGTFNFGGGDLNVPGAQSYVVKYLLDGTYSWAKIYGSSTGAKDLTTTRFWKIALTPDQQSFVVLGDFQQNTSIGGPALVGNPLHGTDTSDLLLGQFTTSNGTWQSQFAIVGSAAAASQPRGLLIDASGNIVCIGYFRGTSVDFGNGVTLNSPNGGTYPKGFIVKFSPLFIASWKAQFSGPGSSEILGSAFIGLNPFVVGYFGPGTTSFDAKSVNSTTGNAGIVARMNL